MGDDSSVAGKGVAGGTTIPLHAASDYRKQPYGERVDFEQRLAPAMFPVRHGRESLHRHRSIAARVHDDNDKTAVYVARTLRMG